MPFVQLFIHSELDERNKLQFCVRRKAKSETGRRRAIKGVELKKVQHEHQLPPRRKWIFLSRCIVRAVTTHMCLYFYD